jgi:hypothetical protein
MTHPVLTLLALEYGAKGKFQPSTRRTAMFLTRLTVAREGYYASYNKADPSKPLRATVEVAGAHGKTELDLGPEASDRIVAIIADELAKAARATAEAMTAEIISGQNLIAA